MSATPCGTQRGDRRTLALRCAPHRHAGQRRERVARDPGRAQRPQLTCSADSLAVQGRPIAALGSEPLPHRTCTPTRAWARRMSGICRRRRPRRSRNRLTLASLLGLGMAVATVLVAACPAGAMVAAPITQLVRSTHRHAAPCRAAPKRRHSKRKATTCRRPTRDARHRVDHGRTGRRRERRGDVERVDHVQRRATGHRCRRTAGADRHRTERLEPAAAARHDPLGLGRAGAERSDHDPAQPHQLRHVAQPEPGLHPSVPIGRADGAERGQHRGRA